MKRSALLVLALALLLPMGTVHGQGEPSWTCSVDNQADTLVLCIAASPTGMRRYITDVVAQSTSANAGLFELQSSRPSALGVSDCTVIANNATLLPPGIDTAAAGRFAAAGNAVPPTVITLPLIVPSGRDLCVLGDPTNPVTLQISGVLAP